MAMTTGMQRSPVMAFRLPKKSSHARNCSVYKYEFDLNNNDQAALVEQLADLDKMRCSRCAGGAFWITSIAQTRVRLMLLLTVYPDAVRTIRRMVQAGVEAELMTHEQQRIDQLLNEVGSSEEQCLPIKMAIYCQTDSQSPADEDDDSEPMPVFKPVALKPVLPGKPDGQPKQLRCAAI